MKHLHWLYAAVESTIGDAFWWELPRLDADCCTVFLQQFCQYYAESLTIVLLDQASAHGAQRVPVPENVMLVGLPAYSPEWNPVERLKTSSAASIFSMARSNRV